MKKSVYAAFCALTPLLYASNVYAQTQEPTTVEEVVVTASILDQNQRALNQQKAADNTVDVVSADSIGRFPDPNVAESLQRLPGVGVERDQGEGRYVNLRGAPVEFSAVTVNGVSLPSQDPDSRAVSLDTLPSDMVSKIEVSKTLVPSQEADSISGAINLVTRSPFDSRGLSISGLIGGSYNDYGGKDERYVLTMSDVWGSQSQFGGVLSVSFSETDRKPENVESGWARLNRPEGGSVFGVAENLFKDYDTLRTRLSIAGGLEWRPDDVTELYLRGNVAKYEDDEFRNMLRILYTDGTLQAGATDRTATFTNTRIEKQIRHRVQRNEVQTIEVGGSRDFGELRGDAQVAWTSSEQTYPRRDELLWRSTIRPTLSYDYANPDEPAFSLFTTNEHLNTAAFGFRENTFRSNDTTQEQVQVRANIAFDHDLFGTDAEWRFGVSYRENDVVADEERWRDRSSGAAPAGGLAAFLSGEESRNYGYFLGYKQDQALADDYLIARRALRSAATRRVEQSVTADYAALEKISGVYGMTRADFGATDVVVGLRIESTSFEGSANRFNIDTSAITPTRTSSSDTHLFPNLTVRHEFSDALVGRFALTRSINRANYVDLVPRVTEDQDGAILRVSQGNAALESTLSNNFDAGLAWYLSRFGVVGVNVFYKDLENYRYDLTLTGPYGAGTALITSPQNAPEGHLAGVEIDWRQQFDFLPGFASNFGVLANATFTDAEIDLGQTYAGRSKMPLPGQSETAYNVALFYDDGNLNARLSYTKRSDYLDEVNADDAAFDLYWEGRGQLDFTAAYSFMDDRYEVFMEAKNLSDTPGVRYYGSRERTYEYEKFGYSIFAGLRFRM